MDTGTTVFRNAWIGWRRARWLILLCCMVVVISAAGVAGAQPNVNQTLIERWNGTSWRVQSSPDVGGVIGPVENDLYAAASTSATDAWAVGNHFSTNVNHPTATLTEHWDGTSWQVQPSPNPSVINRLRGVAATSTTNAWTVGYRNGGSGSADQTLIERWNGSSWRVQSSPNIAGQFGALNNELYAIDAMSASDAWAVGDFRNPSNLQTQIATLIEHWNGTSWQIAGGANASLRNYLRGVAATSATNAWAVGYHDSGGTLPVERTLIERWDGSSWQVQPSPNVGLRGVVYGSDLLAVTATSATDAWAVGYWVPGTLTAPLIEHWDGTSWKVVATPNPGVGECILFGVVATSATDAWAVGEGPNNEPLIEHWDGTSWKIVASPTLSPGAFLRGVTATSTTNAWAAGTSGPSLDPTS